MKRAHETQARKEAYYTALAFKQDNDYDALHIEPQVLCDVPTIQVWFSVELTRQELDRRPHVQQILDQLDELVKGQLG